MCLAAVHSCGIAGCGCEGQRCENRCFAQGNCFDECQCAKPGCMECTYSGAPRKCYGFGHHAKVLQGYRSWAATTAAAEGQGLLTHASAREESDAAAAWAAAREMN